MKTVTIPKEEYDRLKEVYALLQDQDFLKKLNHLAELLLFERWGVVIPEETSDLTEAAMGNIPEWDTEKSVWDDV